MKKTTVTILIILLLITPLAACGAKSPEAPANTPVINPKAEAANKDTSSVTLYFSYRGEEFLAGETRQIDVPVSDTLEAAVIRSLIGGPSADRDELSGLFWDGVQLVGVSPNEDILFVTLSDAFVSTDPTEISLEEGSVKDQKKLAIHSIVNTIVEMGRYSRVQIFVDRAATETGERITLSEAGYSGDSGAYLEPLGREAPLILTAENTLREALESYAFKDWTRLYDFTAYTSPDSTVKPDITAFSDALSAQGNVLESYNVASASVSFDGKTAVVMLDYSLRTKARDTIKRTNIPVVMVRTNDIWELSYSSLVNVLINVG